MSGWTLFFVPITSHWSRVLRCALCASLPPASSLRCAAVINRSVRGNLFCQPILLFHPVETSQLTVFFSHNKPAPASPNQPTNRPANRPNRSNEHSTDHTIFLQQYLQHRDMWHLQTFCLNNVREDPVKITCCLRSCTALFSRYKNPFLITVTPFRSIRMLRSHAGFFNNEYKDLLWISKSLALTHSIPNYKSFQLFESQGILSLTKFL